MATIAILGQEQRWVPRVTISNITDQMVMLDTAAENVILPRSFSDSASFSDSSAENVVLGRSVSESYSFSDLAARLVAFSRSISDSGSFSDSVTRGLILTRNINDSSTFGETLVRSLIFSRSISDTGSFSDSITRTFVGSRSLADSATFSDSVTRSLLLLRSLTDALSISDVVTGSVLTPAHSATDTVLQSDSATVYTVSSWASQLPSDLLLDFTGNAAAGNIGHLAQPVLDGLAQTILTLLRNQGQIGSTFVFATQKTTFTADFTFRIQLLMTNNPYFAALMRRNGYNP